MSKTTIEWATHSVSPASGCSEARLSDGTMDPACRNCYARLQTARVSAMSASQGRTSVHDGVSRRVGGAAVWTGVLRWDRELLRRQFAAMRPGHRTFVGPLTDLWHPDHDPALLVALAEEIRDLDLEGRLRRFARGISFDAPIVITLTKRADRLLAWQREHFPEGLPSWHWAGVTAGNQQAADERIPLLLQVVTHGPRVVSVEPMTGPVDLRSINAGNGHGINALTGERDDMCRPERPDTGRLGWVICGAESRQGRAGAPMDLAWVRALLDQCVAAGTPFFFKQGSVDGRIVGLPELDGRVWDQVPEVSR